MFQQQPDNNPHRAPRLDFAALQREAASRSDEAQKLREAEINRIFELLAEEPERWDGLS